MKANQTSESNGIQNLLAPMSDLRITQGANEIFSHKGSTAIDTASKVDSNLYAPCDCICVAIDKVYAFVMWQSTKPVRLANGEVDFACFYFGHDSNINATVGMVVKQGRLIAQEGTGGNVTGKHCHIEVAKGKYTGRMWMKNSNGVYVIPNAVSFEDGFYMDQTTISSGNLNWKYVGNDSSKIKEETVRGNLKLTLPATANTWRVYPLDKKPVVGNEIGVLKPAMFNGLTYEILQLNNSIAIIQTRDFGKVQIYVGDETGAIIK